MTRTERFAHAQERLGKRIIVLHNGPPRSGKDTLSKLVFRDMHARGEVAFKDRLVHMACSIAGVSVVEWRDRYDQYKEESWHKLPGNRSQRQWLIFVSEEIIKPKLGNSYMGEALKTSIRESEIHRAKMCEKFLLGQPFTNYRLLVTSDSGFEAETDPLFDLGELILVRLYRTGCDYSHCSRAYLRDRDEYMGIVDLANQGNIEDVCRKLEEEILDIVED